MISVPMKRLHENAVLPFYAHPGDAGLDLRALHEVRLEDGGRQLVSTGIAMAIPAGYVGLIHPRSGLAHKHGVTVLNTPGTIDSGYRGEVKVNLFNSSPWLYVVEAGERIAQLVFQKVEVAEVAEVESLDDLGLTARGDGGHGSTGVS